MVDELWTVQQVTVSAPVIVIVKVRKLAFIMQFKRFSLNELLVVEAEQYVSLNVSDWPFKLQYFFTFYQPPSCQSFLQSTLL